MTQDEIDKWTEALRDQGLTLGQTMFAVSLVLEAIHTEREACALIGDYYHDEEANCGDLIRLRGKA